MQVSSTKSVEFEPFSIKIVVESKVDYDTLKSLALTNESVPEAVKNSTCEQPKFSYRKLHSFLDELAMVLKKEKK